MINEIVEGVLVDVIAAAGHRLGAATLAVLGRKGAEDLAIARWFNTYKLTGEPPELPGLSAAATDRLAACLGGSGIHAVLHELLAARLTDAPEADVDRIRVLFDLTLRTESEDLSQLTSNLFDYYDGQIADLTGRLEGSDSLLLSQIRSEAFSARMIAILHAIERHTASLSSSIGPNSRADFLLRYKRHVAQQHGRLEPPDFERRRRIPIGELYVSPRISQLIDAGAVRQPAAPDQPQVDLLTLSDLIDRTVLLGDPGGGKTTAANVLMYQYATDADRRTPFLVTLRDFASVSPPERSVAGHIERNLEVFYQCPAPAGLIPQLLLTGAAVVIFDGLDELLDATRRIEVTAIVERFCTEYPLVPVLVTSRLVGYDQARLDDSQFLRYQIGGFTDDQVDEYVRKWFAQDEGKTGRSSDWADAFMRESASVPDLRANPLMLALMCILYRGEGSLPRNRAEVYEQCSNLLFRKWDARRRIHIELRAAHLLEPALRHLAWWLFTRDQVQPAVTERELIAETTTFLHGPGFESEVTAREAAVEFVGFCRGRLWVFSDTGTTAAGDILYSFTHRTFLEYFAAAHLAYRCDTPEHLAAAVAPRIARQEWEVVSEIAVQIKDHTSHNGADRVYIALLRERRRRSLKGRSAVLQYLARSLRSVDPSPGTVRELTKTILNHLYSGPTNDPLRCLPLSWLISSSVTCREVINDEIGMRIAAMVSSADNESSLAGLRLALWLRDAPLAIKTQYREYASDEFWDERGKERAQTYSAAIVAAAETSLEIRYGAVMLNLLSMAQALEMPGGILPLARTQETGIFGITWASHLINEIVSVALGPWDDPNAEHSSKITDNFVAVGQYLLNRPELPWVSGRVQSWSEYLRWSEPQDETHNPPKILDPIAYLGAAAVLLMATEPMETKSLPEGGPSRFGPLRDVAYYILRRWNQWDQALPDLPVPPQFASIFRRWAEKEIDFSQLG